MSCTKTNTRSSRNPSPIPGLVEPTSVRRGWVRGLIRMLPAGGSRNEPKTRPRASAAVGEVQCRLGRCGRSAKLVDDRNGGEMVYRLRTRTVPTAGDRTRSHVRHSPSSISRAAVDCPSCATGPLTPSVKVLDAGKWILILSPLGSDFTVSGYFVHCALRQFRDRQRGRVLRGVTSSRRDQSALAVRTVRTRCHDRFSQLRSRRKDHHRLETHRVRRPRPRRLTEWAHAAVRSDGRLQRGPAAGRESAISTRRRSGKKMTR